MKAFITLVAVGLASFSWYAVAAEVEAKPESEDPKLCETVAVGDLPTAGEARGRAVLLHETFEATLHALHHHYYREDEGLPIPGVALKDVFRELGDRRGVGVRWLAVDAQAMNVEHLPQNDFERKAVRALAEGRDDFDQTEGELYRYAGTICLTSECLKCHVPNRKSTENRVAAVVITLPLKTPQQ